MCINHGWLKQVSFGKDDLHSFNSIDWWYSVLDMIVILLWLKHYFDYVTGPLDTTLNMNYWWNMGIDPNGSKVDELVRMTLPLYFSIEFVVDEALYGIVWYGPLMVVVFTLFTIYICDVNMTLKTIVLWIYGGDDHTMWSICLVSCSSYDLGYIDNVMTM